MPRFPKPVALMVLSVLTASVVGACSSTDPLGPSVQLSFVVSQPVALPSTLQIGIGSSSAALHVDTPSPGASARMHVMGYGEKPVQLTVVGNQSDTLATASFSESLQANHDYGIAAVVARTRPLGTCVAVVSAVPLRNSPSDTMFVLRSGLPKGAMC